MQGSRWRSASGAKVSICSRDSAGFVDHMDKTHPLSPNGAGRLLESLRSDLEAESLVVHPSTEDLLNRVLNGLEIADRRRIDEHLLACSTCAAEMVRLGEIVQESETPDGQEQIERHWQMFV